RGRRGVRRGRPGSTGDRRRAESWAPYRSLIGSEVRADKSDMRRDDRDAYQAWLVGELLLVGLLGAALALFLAYPDLRSTYELPELRLALDTTMALPGGHPPPPPGGCLPCAGRPP